MKIEKQKVVQIHYKGTLKDGSVFDSSEGREPLTFMFGSGMIIPGLEEGLEGLEKGAKKTVEIPCDKAYGQRSEEAIQEVPRDQLPTEVELKEGLQLMAQTPHGPMPVKVAEVKEDKVKMDFNHPLAGQDLTFEVEVVEVRDATEKELAHGHSHAPNSECETGESDENAQASEEKKE